MTDSIFVVLDDWRVTCRNLEELSDTLIEISKRPYTAGTLLEEFQQVAQRELTDWQEVRQLGFDNRDEAENVYYAECKRRNK